MFYLMWVLFGHWHFFFFKQKTAYELRIGDWSSDVCSSDLMEDMVGPVPVLRGPGIGARRVENRAPHPVDAAHGLPVQSARVVGNALDIVRIDAEKSLPAPPEAGHFPAQIQRGKGDGADAGVEAGHIAAAGQDRKSTRLNSSH